MIEITIGLGLALVATAADALMSRSKLHVLKEAARKDLRYAKNLKELKDLLEDL